MFFVSLPLLAHSGDAVRDLFGYCAKDGSEVCILAIAHGDWSNRSSYPRLNGAPRYDFLESPGGDFRSNTVS